MCDSCILYTPLSSSSFLFCPCVTYTQRPVQFDIKTGENNKKNTRICYQNRFGDNGVQTWLSYEDVYVCVCLASLE